MGFIRIVFSTAIISILVACGSKDEAAEQYQIPKASGTVNASNTLANEFDRPSAEVVNCMLMGRLSELAYEGKASGEHCGDIDKNGLVKFMPEFMALDPMFTSRETTCYLISQDTSPDSRKFLGWYYMTKDGFGRGHAENHDNDCTEWEYLPAGISKTYVGGRLAYMDKGLAIVRQTNYLFGEDFDEENLAIVCSEKPSKRYGPHKEHYAWADGKCGQINLDFDVVTPVEQVYENFNPLPEWAHPFYSRQINFRAHAGKGEALKVILDEALRDIPGLKRASATLNIHDTDLVIVSERWDNKAAHTASLELSKVKNAIARGWPLIKDIEHQSDYEFTPENN